jgi:hypothetical protein
MPTAAFSANPVIVKLGNSCTKRSCHFQREVYTVDSQSTDSTHSGNATGGASFRVGMTTVTVMESEFAVWDGAV